MHKLTIILTSILALAFSSMLIADSNMDAEAQNSVNITMQIKGLEDINTRVTSNRTEDSEPSDAAYFGLYLEDLTFPKAQALGYKGNHGVLITGVVRDSPAWSYRMQEDDIILSINNREVSNYAAFEKIRKTLRAGDVISIAVFRNGKNEGFDMTIGSRSMGQINTESPKIPHKTKLSRGYGGASWVPMWIDTDMEDINKLISQPELGFGKFPDGFVLQQGFSGKLPIGKGYFLGGQITSYHDSKRKNVDNSNYHVWMQYGSTMGGVTLDKRIPITKNLISSLGLMVGAANHKLEFVNTDANYDWDSMPDIITDSNNTHFKLSKGYLLAQPRAELLLRFTPWLGIRAEGGYAYGINLREDWRVIGMGDEQYEITGSPNTNYQGFTFTVGPWFGF